MSAATVNLICVSIQALIKRSSVPQARASGLVEIASLSWHSGVGWCAL